MTEETKTPMSEIQKDDFTMFLAFATQGIMASIPFGVNVDPKAVAAASKNVALAMLEVQAEATE